MTGHRDRGTGRVQVVLASNNEGKIAELRQLLPDWVAIRSAREANVTLPEETEPTFAGNALLKARAAAAQTGLTAVADDSGLVVDALGGEPGVRSARYAGEPGDDRANIALLLERLAGVPPADRGARFRSAVAIVLPDGREHVSEGSVDGVILERLRGTGGFGYDPLFQPAGYLCSMAELTIEEKNGISHRGRAFRAAAPWLLPIMEDYVRDGHPAAGTIACTGNENGELHE